jgi:drug/metabolite transporter (DMT)-like permease
MSRRAWILFALISLLWGVPYLFIKVAVAEVSPVFLVFLRTALASLALLPLAWKYGALRDLRSLLLPLAVVAVVEVTVPFTLIGAGEQRISSSLTGLLIASQPLMVAGLALGLDQRERIGPDRLAGLLLGLLGVAVVLGIDPGGDSGRFLGAAMVLGATASYALAALLVQRWFAGRHQLLAPAGTVALNTVLMLPAAALTAPAALPSAAAIGAILVLGFACTAGGFVGYFSLIAEAGASRASVVTYVNPIVAVLAGSLVLGERVGPSTLAGFTLVVAGSVLATWAGRRPAPERAEASRLAEGD